MLQDRVPPRPPDEQALNGSLLAPTQFLLSVTTKYTSNRAEKVGYTKRAS